MDIFNEDYYKKITPIIKDIFDTSVYDKFKETIGQFDKDIIPLKEAANNLATVTSILKDINTPKIEIDKDIMNYISSVTSVLIDFSKYYKDINLDIKKINNLNYISDGKSSFHINQASDALILKKMFPDILLKECEEFINYISQIPMLSYKNEIGKKIYSFINSIKGNTINNLIIYRVRKHEYGKKLAYLDDEMFEAPYKWTQQSRFSSTGQNYLYTSEKLEIAIKEVKQKKSDNYTWIELKVIKPFSIINIRDKNISLFEYCHFKSEDKKNKMNTEYLLPNFIADCAKQVGFEGIMYYSVIDNTTNNYVFFKPGKRDFEITNRGRGPI